ncbi:DUF3833 family protein [Sphingomonas sp.]|uniref:DUF3833 family protein n=1 Tax=Sphingomonas sp. TaxID=28214 RepID=UPI0035BBCABB
MPVPPRGEAAGHPFDPIAFFDGHTQGNGRLKALMSGMRTVRVSGEGKTIDGTLTLVQRVEQEGKAARTRRWHLRQVAPGHYAGDLSDAAGPVTADISGNRLHIRFNAKGGFAVEQWLVLQPGGRAAQNHLVVRKFGIRVAVLDETIRKID